MPQLRILTWNSNGESPDKARVLFQVLGHLERDFGWQPDVVLIQEAAGQAPGPIADFLTRSGAFQTPIHRLPEGGNQGRAYLMAVAHHVEVRRGLGVHALADDPDVGAWVDAVFSPAHRSVIRQEIAGFRGLGVAELAIHGRPVRLACWHAPRDPSRIGTAPHVLPGGANPDAFLSFAVSSLDRWLENIPPTEFAVLAGDLNIRQDALHRAVALADGSHFEVLAGWTGFGQGLDYVVAPPTFLGRMEGFHYDGAPSDHSIVGATLTLD